MLHSSGGEGGKLKYSETCMKMQITRLYTVGVMCILLCKILPVSCSVSSMILPSNYFFFKKCEFFMFCILIMYTNSSVNFLCFLVFIL
jgi:hypothetical protein